MIIKQNQKKCCHTDGVIGTQPCIGGYEEDELFINGEKVKSNAKIWVAEEGKIGVLDLNTNGADFKSVNQHKQFGPHEGGVKQCKDNHTCSNCNNPEDKCNCNKKTNNPAMDELIESIVKFNPFERLKKAVELGILYDEQSAKIREYNAGKSNYAHRLIQAWSIFEENPQLNYLECDIIKRLLRTKEEAGMTMLESRMLDIKKIKHIVNELERTYSIELEKEKQGK